MANYRFYTRRIRRIAVSPIFQIVAICLCLIFGINWVIRHNHDDDVDAIPAARPTTTVEDPSIDWSKRYYVQYVTSPEYLCNALMVWSEIEEIGSRAQRMMLYPSTWDPNKIDDYSPSLDYTPIARLLQEAQTKYYVKLQPVDIMHRNGTVQPTWADSYTKLLAFNLTQFDRVLVLDSDSIVLKNLDSVFLLPAAPVAMPHVYWGAATGWAFSSQFLLLTPSATTFSQIESAIRNAKDDEYDMDILNRLFQGRILKIPQRPFNLLSGEFRRSSHAAYLSSRSEKWNPDTILSEAHFLHFSDWPVPKPWMVAPKELLNKHMPKCKQSEWFGATNCRDRAVWLKLYWDFAVRRKSVCGPGFELQSQELPENSIYRHGKWYHPDDVGG
ncbi:hypothetical protein EG329_002188 [Mollisiaceae sp. DMI_Dod_QoI]|nr:hypothetical protein EG329_002188 [Helotiales sp. DMI_Dod_QoI]